MSFKKIVLMMGLVLWVGEPFMGSAEKAPSSQSPACSTCGMKNTCGTICCCAHSTMTQATRQEPPGFYPAGCHADGPHSGLFPDSLVRWLPPSGIKTLPIFIPLKLSFRTIYPPSVFLEVPTPPPNRDFIS